MTSYDLTGRTALVTGGAQGLGPEGDPHQDAQEHGRGEVPAASHGDGGPSAAGPAPSSPRSAGGTRSSCRYVNSFHS